MAIRQTPRYKQMSLETAVRNPERYKEILAALIRFENVVLNDDNLLDIVVHLYKEGIVSATNAEFENLNLSQQRQLVKRVNSTRRADGGFPQGYPSRFWTYMRTLSEFGFVKAEYNKPLLISRIAKLLVDQKIDDQIAFATQSAIYNRKSPFRNVSNDFNYFCFITEVLVRLNEDSKGLTYEQFIVSLFSKEGNVDDFINEIKLNTFADENTVYEYVVNVYEANNKQHTITRDYPDAVLRLLKITGFISIKYSSRVVLYLNTDKIDLIKEIFSKKYSFTEEQKLDKELFYKQYLVYSDALLKITATWAGEQNEDVHKKLKLVVDNYSIDSAKIITMLNDFQANKDKEFKYVPAPLKLEFYLSLMLYLTYGDTHIVAPNYKSDSLGMPISHAPGNHGDIYVYSEFINWLIEVTMIRNKQQQLNSETTSVVRHLEEDTRDSYLSFVAPYVHEDTKTFFDNALIGMIMNDRTVYLKTYAIEEFVNDTKNASNLMTMKAYFNNIHELAKRKFSSH